MYKTIVKNKVRGTFQALSEGRSEELIKQLAEPFVYEFIGDHALGGTQTSKDTMEKWFARIDQIFGRLQFKPLHIEVGGFPWNTTVLAEVEVSGTVAGEPYENIIFQRIELRMGKIHFIRTLENTQHLVDVFQKAHAAGVSEATKEPITD